MRCLSDYQHTDNLNAGLYLLKIKGLKTQSITTLKFIKD